MKSIILSRLKELKLQLRDMSSQKLIANNKSVSEEKIIALLARIDELKRLLLHKETK